MNCKDILTLHPIAYMHTDFPEKFGIPRQADLVQELKGTIVFEKDYQKEGILKGLEQYSHIWVIWGFSEFYEKEWSPTVRPPRLGGNQRLGVFATRSPNRPSHLGLSACRMEAVRKDPEYGLVIDVSGVDMKDGTPVYDIKPYIPYSDCIPDAKEGFAAKPEPSLKVIIPEHLARKIPANKIEPLKKILSYDPRPAYQKDPERIYGLAYASMNIQFKVSGEELEVVSISSLSEEAEGSV